jgi:hypothetical protein
MARSHHLVEKMSTVAFIVPRRRFTEIDFLLISFWLAFWVLEVVLKPPVFMAWAVAGGGLMTARHLYFVVYRGESQEGDLVIAAASPALVLFTGFSGWIVTMTPVTLDSQLAALDHGIARLVRTWTTQHLQVYWLLCVVYNSLPFAAMLCASFLRGKDRWRLGYAIILGGLLVTPLYLLFPAVGPAHIGDPNAPRNCMPSMHLTWALLLWVNSKSWMKWLTGIYAALTAIATLATGEHYTLDLLMALPFVWVISMLVRNPAAAIAVTGVGNEDSSEVGSAKPI